MHYNSRTIYKDIKEESSMNIYNQLLNIYCKKKSIDKNKDILKNTFNGFGPELTQVLLQCIDDEDYIISRIDGHLIRKDKMTDEEWARENGIKFLYQ